LSTFGTDTTLTSDTTELTDNERDELAIQERTAKAYARRDSVRRADSAQAIQNQPAEQPAGDESTVDDQPADNGNTDSEVDTSAERPIGSNTVDPPKVPDRKKYTLAVNKAFFYSQPNINTRREAHLVHWNNAELTALDDKNGFIYVVFFNTAGQVTKGWLKKSDLKRIGR
jgi:serine/threonine-protein kinase